TPGRGAVGDDDRLGTRGVESLGPAQRHVSAARGLEYVTERYDVKIVRTVALVLGADAGLHLRFTPRQTQDFLVPDQDLRFRNRDGDALLVGVGFGDRGRQPQIVTLGDGVARLTQRLQEEDQDDGHDVEHGRDVEEVDLRLVRVPPD